MMNDHQLYLVTERDSAGEEEYVVVCGCGWESLPLNLEAALAQPCAIERLERDAWRRRTLRLALGTPAK